MKSARTIIGNYCYKKSTGYILNKCNMLPIKEFMIYATVKFFYGIELTNEPKAMLSLFMDKNQRQKYIKFQPIYKPKLSIVSKSCVHEGSRIYNTIPNDLKRGSKKTFAKNIKDYISQFNILDAIKYS